MTKSQGYQEQFDRVKRFYEHFKLINDGLPLPCNDKYKIYDLDEIYAFFIFCYHLKDWIKNDDSVDKPIREEVEDFVSENDCLKVCADICNGLKHLVLNPNRMRSEKQPEFKSKKVSVNFKGKEQPVMKVKFFVSTDSGKKDAFELATECLKTWEKFIVCQAKGG